MLEHLTSLVNLLNHMDLHTLHRFFYKAILNAQDLLFLPTI